jgi:hypothetical protein
MIMKLTYIKRGMHAKGIWKQDPEANIWAQEGLEWGGLHNEELHILYHSGWLNLEDWDGQDM